MHVKVHYKDQQGDERFSIITVRAEEIDEATSQAVGEVIRRNQHADILGTEIVELKPEHMKIIVIGYNHYWGRGDTLREALNNARKPRHYTAFIVHPDSAVNDMGAISYPIDFPPKEFHEVKPGKVRRARR